MELDYSRRKYVVARRQLKRGREKEKKKRNGDPQLMVIRTMRFNQLMIACDRVPERARARSRAQGITTNSGRGGGNFSEFVLLFRSQAGGFSQAYH